MDPQLLYLPGFCWGQSVSDHINTCHFRHLPATSTPPPCPPALHPTPKPPSSQSLVLLLGAQDGLLESYPLCLEALLAHWNKTKLFPDATGLCHVCSKCSPDHCLLGWLCDPFLFSQHPECTTLPLCLGRASPLPLCHDAPRLCPCLASPLASPAPSPSLVLAQP